MTTSARAHARRRRVAVWGFGATVAVQVALMVIGVAYIVAAADPASVSLLLVWCVVGSCAVLAIFVLLAAASRWAETDEPPMVMELSPPARAVSLIATVLVSAVGVAATIQHLLIDPDDDDTFVLNVVGVWAMILAWMLLHWGFAQLYLQQYYLETDRPLKFPGTAAPGILEFAYFAYTVAVSLAVSDVEVRDRRMRWRVLVHTVTSFFFNGLIIVTAFNAIAGFARL